jgi:hypothetical protein
MCREEVVFHAFVSTTKSTTKTPPPTTIIMT